MGVVLRKNERLLNHTHQNMFKCYSKFNLSCVTNISGSALSERNVAKLYISLIRHNVIFNFDNLHYSATLAGKNRNKREPFVRSGLALLLQGKFVDSIIDQFY